jgi:hypothetical protein
MLIHIQRDGQQFGPYTLEDLNQYLADGSLLPSDLAWYEGATNWVHMNQVPGVVMPLSGFPSSGKESVSAASSHSLSGSKKIMIGASVGVLVAGIGLAFGMGWVGGGESGPVNKTPNQSDPVAETESNDSSSKEGNILFSKVEPIFRKHRCFECHHSKESKKAKADLDFSIPSTTEAFTSPNQKGNPATAPLVLAITPGASEPMPPNGPMIPKGEVAIIMKWIAGGAKF